MLLIPLTVAHSQGKIGSGGTVGSSKSWTISNVYTKTNFTTALLDTTNWFTIEPNTELAFIFRSTDSAAVDVYIDGRNSFYGNVNGYVTYSDSLTVVDTVAGGQNVGETRKVLIKTTTLNRLNSPANNQCRLRVDHRASGAGTTSGRQLNIDIIKEQ